jgi:hypothetical protein
LFGRLGSVFAQPAAERSVEDVADLITNLAKLPAVTAVREATR